MSDDIDHAHSIISQLFECRCIPRYSIEPHGNGYAIYQGRCQHRHGYNVARITECNREDIIKFLEDSLNTRTKPEYKYATFEDFCEESGLLPDDCMFEIIFNAARETKEK